MNTKDSLIESLIKERYLKAPRIIEAFRAIDRADFVRPEYRGEAYGNYPLPIGEGQTISQPLTVAFMLELLDPRPGEKILDIGSGSGWTTALLAQIVGAEGKAIGMERISDICEFGKKNLAKYFDEKRAKIICGDAAPGLPEEAPFDKILAGAAALQEIPQSWREQLKVGGRIVAPVGGSVWVFIKKSETEWEEIEHPGFAFVPLVKDERQRTKDESSNFHKIILGIALVFSLSALGLFTNEIYRPHTSFQGSRAIEISSGLGSRQIAEVLKKEGVIRSRWALVIYVSLKGKASQLKPGSYVFSPAAIPEIVRDLVRGGTNERVITVPEGWSVKDIAEYLRREGITKSDVFLRIVDSPSQTEFGSKFDPNSVWDTDRFDFLKDKPDNLGLDGYLFPDTYRIFKDARPEEIISKMLENFGKKLTPELREEITRRNLTIFDVIRMASLIEKEVVSDENRAIVSGILWKRLGAGIGLQVDAAISYITGKKTTRISLEETKIDSPYNTYKYRGLPIGPIGNPGLSAIRAAIYPKESPYLYYLSTPDGRTIFSKTLEEHNAAKTRYLH